jgi:hypothetical protein
LKVLLNGVTQKEISMKHLLTVFLLSLFTLTSTLAQDEEPAEKGGFDKSRLFFGGNFGANFGDYTIINVSPQLGYRFSNFFSAGAGVNFIYSSIKYRDYNNDPEYRAAYGVTGLNVFGRVYPIQQVLLQAQPELNYTWGKYKYYNGAPDYKLDKEFVPSLLVGAGAAIPSGRGAFMAMLQYDVLQKDRSPYGKRPFLSFGYSMGF